MSAEPPDTPEPPAPPPAPAPTPPLPSAVALYHAVAQVGGEYAKSLAPLRPLVPQGVRLSSYLLMAAGLLVVLWQGLLPGLLFACLGFSLTRWLAGQLSQIPRDSLPNAPLPRWTQVTAATLVGAAPVLPVLLGLSPSRGYLSVSPQQ